VSDETWENENKMGCVAWVDLCDMRESGIAVLDIPNAGYDVAGESWVGCGSDLQI